MLAPYRFYVQSAPRFWNTQNTALVAAAAAAGIGVGLGVANSTAAESGRGAKITPVLPSGVKP